MKNIPRELIKEYLDVVENLYFKGISLDKAVVLGKRYLKMRMK